jgi:hypothetical protein
VPGGMDVPVPARVLSELRELRRELHWSGPVVPDDWRAGLDKNAKQRVVELLAATERQLAGQGRGGEGLRRGRSAGSTQVRGDQPRTSGRESRWLIWG